MPPSPTPTAAPPRVVAHALTKASLVPFHSCGDLLARMRREALAQVGPYGLPYVTGPLAVSDHVMIGGAASSPALAAAPAGGQALAGGPDFSPTNNQEVGVDEADLVKTDGRLLAVLRQDRPGVQVVDVSGTKPRLRGFFPLAQGLYGGQLLLVGRRLVVLGQGAPRRQDHGRPWTEVLVLSLADPDHPRVQRTFAVDGSLSAARSLGGRVLLVTQSTPDLLWSYPRDGSAAGLRKATQQNRRLIRLTRLRTWLPSVTALRTGRTYRPTCSAMWRTQTTSGTATTAVVSIDPASDVPGRPVVVAGSGSVVYASSRAVYVTTVRWQSGPMGPVASSGAGGESTSVHRFDVSDPALPRYTGSGSVLGTLVGQYALSEHDGLLRVASTVGRGWALRGEKQPPSDNLVTVLRPEPGRLVRIGRIRGLGRGERIYGVRFVGDLGYVVTFRETDPLYVLDLSDPRHPRRRGELHLTGFSSYLHPLADGMLLGIGREVDASGPTGTQVSTFDVSDPRAPRLRARQVFPHGWSNAEEDPHAVLWWPATRLLVVPLTQGDPAAAPDQAPFQGAVALRVDADGALHELGRLQAPQDTPSGATASPLCCWSGILRSVVVGDEVLTLSGNGVLASSLDSLKERAWLPYL